jgi:uncharacterized protein (TIGR03032 family)
MKLDAAFVRLPYRFDPQSARDEIARLDDDAWQTHPRKLDGHRVVPLISADGEDDLTRMDGRMAATRWLESLPALQRILAAPDTIVGRAFLVRADAGASPPRTVDAGAYWHRRTRIFMTIEGGESALWRCGQEESPIPDGEMWLLDGWRGFDYTAGETSHLVYLVVDSVGSGTFWTTVRSADRPLDPERSDSMSPRQLGNTSSPRALETETVRPNRVMSPWEMESLVADVMDDARATIPPDAPHLPKLEAALSQFTNQWQAIHARHGEDEAGDPAYRQAMEQLVAQAGMFAGNWTLPNGLDVAQALYQTIVLGALRDADGRPVIVVPPNRKPQQRAAKQETAGQAQAPAPAAEADEQPAAGIGAPARAPAPPQPDEPGPNARGGAQHQAQNLQDPKDSPLRSVHTASLPTLLQQAASSLLVSTYQAGKLVIVRENEGKLNTHFRVYNRPMGLAADGGRMALGTAATVEYYRNMPEVARKLQPEGRHDAAFLPRHGHITGNIDIHEMDWAGDELWLVNTRFSCLCTLDGEHSFVPRWRPKFISGYAAEDRCHLNGLEVVDGRPRYVTALGTSDVAGGWRENKAGGGVLIDIDSDEIICRGLSMPHSPRWYQDKLWVLESGNGTLATVDSDNGQLETVAELPGFTRGLDFLGPYAFVGLSQVRESAVFSGISLTERVSERNCGVWVVDIRSGQTVAFLKFEDAVQEVFAVSVLGGMRFPDVLGGNDPHLAISYSLPDEALKEVVRSEPADAAKVDQSGG